MYVCMYVCVYVRTHSTSVYVVFMFIPIVLGYVYDFSDKCLPYSDVIFQSVSMIVYINETLK